jgi:hypothetical protein
LPTLMALFQDPRATTRALAVEVFATCAQNNPPVQKAGLDASVLEALCHMIRTDTDMRCRVKALLGISSMVRGLDKTAERWFVKHCDGLELILDCLATSGDDDELPLTRKALFFLRYLVNASLENASVLLAHHHDHHHHTNKNRGYIAACARLIGHGDIDLNESTLQALAEFASLGPAFKEACKAPAVGLIEKVQARLRTLNHMTGAEREAVEEEKSLATLVLEHLDVLD